MMKKTLFFTLLVAGLAACTEKPQELHQGKTVSGTPAYQGTGSNFTAPGWEAGNRDSWEETLKVRSRGQNEYNRVR